MLANNDASEITKQTKRIYHANSIADRHCRGQAIRVGPLGSARSEPMTKERIIAKAQAEANRDGKALAVLNLNPFSPLYVIRFWDESFAQSPRAGRQN